VRVGGLFRRGAAGAVYVAEGGRGREGPVRLAARGDRDAAVADGLHEGELVIVHPSDKVSDRSRIRVR
jgi:HlyD family secretion protein